MIDAYNQQFTQQPNNMFGVSVVVCTHPQHGVYQFYVPDGAFQKSLVPIIRGAWVNGFVVVIYPAV